MRLVQGDMAQRDGLQRRSGRAGGCLRDAGVRLAARGRSRRRLRRQADQCAGGRGDPQAPVTIPVQLGGGIRDLEHRRGLARPAALRRVIIGTAAVRDPELVREAARDIPGRDRGRHRRPRRHGRRRGLGRDRPRCRRSELAHGSRTPASPRSSSPTSPATALLKGLNIEATARARRRASPSRSSPRAASPPSTTSRRMLAPDAPRSSKAPSPAARSMTAGSIPPPRSTLIRDRRAAAG